MLSVQKEFQKVIKLISVWMDFRQSSTTSAVNTETMNFPRVFHFTALDRKFNWAHFHVKTLNLSQVFSIQKEFQKVIKLISVWMSFRQRFTTSAVNTEILNCPRVFHFIALNSQSNWAHFHVKTLNLSQVFSVKKEFQKIIKLSRVFEWVSDKSLSLLL